MREVFSDGLKKGLGEQTTHLLSTFAAAAAAFLLFKNRQREGEKPEEGFAKCVARRTQRNPFRGRVQQILVSTPCNEEWPLVLERRFAYADAHGLEDQLVEAICVGAPTSEEGLRAYVRHLNDMPEHAFWFIVELGNENVVEQAATRGRWAARNAARRLDAGLGEIGGVLEDLADEINTWGPRPPN